MIPALFKISVSSYVDAIPSHMFIAMVLVDLLKSIVYTNFTALAATTLFIYFFGWNSMNSGDHLSCTQSNLKQLKFCWFVGFILLQLRPAVCLPLVLLLLFPLLFVQ